MDHSSSVSRRRAALTLAALLACNACGSTDTSAPEQVDPPDVKAFMTGYFETFDKRVTDDILPLFAADVSADITGLGKLEGRNAVRDEWLVPFTSAFPDYTHTVKTLTVDGKRATADFVFSGTHQGPLLGNEPTGKKLVLPIRGTYDVEESAVTYFELKYDVAIVFEAITP